MKSKPIIGQVETVSLPQFEVNNILAKIDTGAYYCRMHCDASSKGIDGEIHFVIGDKKFTANTYKPDMMVLTKGITGHEKREYAIKTYMIIRDTKYEVDIVLSSRNNRKYQVLIGRKFLLANDFMVDVCHGIENDVEYNNEVKK